MSNTRTTLAVRAPRTIGVLLAVFAALFAIFLLDGGPGSRRDRAPTATRTASAATCSSTASRSRASASRSTAPAASRRSRPTRRASGASASPSGTPTTRSPSTRTTLPEGIAVVDDEDDTPNVKEAQVGPGGRVTVNFFIGEGTAQRHELLRPAGPAHRQRPQLRPDARARGGRALAGLRHDRASRTSRTREMVTFGPVVAAALVGAGTARPAALGRPPDRGDPQRGARPAARRHHLETAAPKTRRRRPADDRQHRPLADAALHLPVLHRRRHDPAAVLVDREDPALRRRVDERRRHGRASPSASWSSSRSRSG